LTNALLVQRLRAEIIYEFGGRGLYAGSAPIDRALAVLDVIRRTQPIDIDKRQER
jgi:hypothetical protein